MIVALDLETTGLDKEVDAIIEVALIKIDTKTFKVLDTYNTFVNPERDIPELISNITSISQDDVEGAPVFSHVQQEIVDFIGDAPILGHNTQFDRGFLLSHGVPIEKNLVLDTFFLANFLLQDLKSLNLGFISSYFGINITSEHRAIYDTEATVEVYKRLISLLQELDDQKKEIFRYITDRSQDTQWIFYRENYLEKVNKLDDQELIKSILSTIKKQHKPHKIEQNYSEESVDIDKIFSEFKNFEIRENQKKMAKITYETLKEGKKSIIEAPTGVGKTFAYLIPSILFSTQVWEQVFISTSTKTLQDQIFFKDLEFLAQNIGIDFSFTKLKGKKNYIGVHSFFEFLEQEQRHEWVMTCFLLKVLFWLLGTKSWELEELDFYGEEYGFLHEVNANDFYTFSTENTYEEYEFILRARRNARKSNIVIINNNILFQNIYGSGNILGKWKVKNLILDEAHNLEDVITQSLKKSFSLVWLEKVFGELEKKARKAGENMTEVWYKKEKIVFDITTLFECFYSYIHTKVSSDSRYKNVLIKTEFFSTYSDSIILSSKVQDTLDDILDYLKNLPEKKQILFGREVSYFEQVQEVLANIFSGEEKFKEIIPIASHSDRYGVILEYTLLSPGKFLKQSLWDTLDTAVLTSATLQIEGKFDYIKNMLSLEDFDFYELETDFDYVKQSLLFIPSDLGSIKNNSSQIFEFFRELFPLIWGRALVLFTSFFMIQECYVALNNHLKNKGIHLLAQSVSWGKQKQLTFFQENAKNSILVGTDTFWEGIDLKGDDLKYLIIHKVPFMVPSDPIFQARSTLFKDSFAEYSIPKSILKLKQWFGRLIRTKTDSGVVIFLDDRIFSTRWGERFYAAFPTEIKIKISPYKSLLSVIKK